MNDRRTRRPRRRPGRNSERARELIRARSTVTPLFEYPPELPVSAARDEIAAALKDHQVIVVAGETGSGKTTQLPKLCMELGYGIKGMIGHTQPRRIAARAVAARLAEEVVVELGEGVGYQVRFNAEVSDSTRVKVMTDGILLAELQHDKWLSAYEVIIIDEAHERSLNIDFLMGFLARLLPKRPDLKVIITSATIDPESFSRHFSDAPIISVSGRTYPVEIRYRPLAGHEAASDDDADGPGRDGDYEVGTIDQTDGILAAVDELSREGPGDILVFLSGEREIRDTADALSAHLNSKGPRFAAWEIVPLFGRLSAGEQQRVFAAHSAPRVVLATNVAETSLTVPGIKYVIDAGTARISRYSNRTKVQRLPIERISQASARQRSGRAGRTSPGICIRLYSEEDFEARPAFTDPEILRTHLASVVLQMLSLGLVHTENDIAQFPFLTPPDAKAIRDGRLLLAELGAVHTDNDKLRLTKLGRALAALPIDPRMARMVIAGVEAEVGSEVAVIVAALSLQDPRERPSEVRAQADEKHARFHSPTSDFMSFLILWNYIQAKSRELSSSQFRKLCKAEFLNYVRIREWQDLVSQLRSMLGQTGYHIPKPGMREGADETGTEVSQSAEAAVHQALISGLLSSIGQRAPEGKDYVGPRGTRFRIFPGSGLFKANPDMIVAAELVETSRLWARTVGTIEPEWVIKAAGPLIKHQYSEPHWSSRHGSAFAYDRMSLYGLTLSTDQRVNYGRINPAEARELFIRHALIAGEWIENHAFIAHNQTALKKAQQLANRMRDNRVLAGDEVLFDFYDAHLPDNAYSAAHFNSWWKKTRQQTPTLLNLDPEALLADGAESVSTQAATDFPLQWDLHIADEENFPAKTAKTAKLRYFYEPGQARDGVTVQLTGAQALNVDIDQFTWQVPGLRHELFTALIRSLPKPKRKYFVPAPDVAKDILVHVTPYQGDAYEVLAAELTKRAGGGELNDMVPITVSAADFELERVPAHLRLTYELRLPGTRPVRGTDLGAMLKTIQPAPRPGEKPAAPTDVDAGQQAESKRARSAHGAEKQARGAAAAQSAPAGGTAAAKHTPAEARTHVRALAAQIASTATEARNYVLESMPKADKLVLGAWAKYPAPQIVADAVFASVYAILDEHVSDAELAAATLSDIPPSIQRTVNNHILTRLEKMLGAAVQIAGEAGKTSTLVGKTNSLILLPSLSDINELLAGYTAPRLFANTHPRYLLRIPAYLAALRERTEKLGRQAARDKQFLDRVTALRDSVLATMDAKTGPNDLAMLESVQPTRASDAVPACTDALPAQWQELIWDIEELRISLWAPQVGAAHPVSEQRIAKALAKLR